MSNSIGVKEPFSAADQQREASIMGMYLFLAAEIMLFGALIVVLLVVRYLHTAEIVAASRRLSFWIGTANTAVLLTSSLAVALAVEAKNARRAASLLAIAAALGIAFVGLKALEYAQDYREHILPVGITARFDCPEQHLFMNIYLVATSLHGLHVLIGIALLGGMAIRLVVSSTDLRRDRTTVEVPALYWHLVDAVWVFLYPLLYLAR